MKARPLFENVLIKPLEKKKQMKGGILLPEDKNTDALIEGTVAEIGAGDFWPASVQGIGGMSTLAAKPVVVKVGEHVVFKQYAGTSITINNEKFWLLNQRDILSVIDYDG